MKWITITLTWIAVLSSSIATGQIVTTLTDVIDGGTGGLAVNDAGEIFIGDFGQSLNSPLGSRIFKVTPAGEVSVFATGFVGAAGNDFDSQGVLFQSNYPVNRISKILPDGTVSQIFPSSDLSGPAGIAIDDQDDLFVCSCNNDRIVKVTQTGDTTIFAESPLLNCPNGITFDDAGNLYVANFGDSSLLKITPDGTVSTHAFIPGGNTGHVTFFDGNLYVTARADNRIYQVTLSGDVSVFAGNGVRAVVDGPPLEASFSLPNDVIFDPTGHFMYVNDVLGATSNFDTAPMVLRRMDLRNPGALITTQPAAPQRLRSLAYPNPFHPSTTITYALPRAGQVSVGVYDAMGRRVRSLPPTLRAAGTHDVSWDGRGTGGVRVPSGTYFYRIESAGLVATGRLQLTR